MPQTGQGPRGRGGAEQTDSDDGECDGGQAATGASSETGTRRGVKQNTEADPSSMMAENSHLISKMPERETGLPNTYYGSVTQKVLP